MNGTIFCLFLFHLLFITDSVFFFFFGLPFLHLTPTSVVSYLSFFLFLIRLILFCALQLLSLYKFLFQSQVRYHFKNFTTLQMLLFNVFSIEIKRRSRDKMFDAYLSVSHTHTIFRLHCIHTHKAYLQNKPSQKPIINSINLFYSNVNYTNWYISAHVPFNRPNKQL